METNKLKEGLKELESTELWKVYEKLIKESKDKELKAVDLVDIIGVLTGYYVRLREEISELKEKTIK